MIVNGYRGKKSKTAATAVGLGELMF